MVKLLSVDELFARRSLQEHLKRIEKEYNDCLQVVSGSNVAEDEHKEDEMKTKRSKVSLLAPLIQSISELDRKQKEISETEMLLKGEMGIIVEKIISKILKQTLKNWIQPVLLH